MSTNTEPETLKSFTAYILKLSLGMWKKGFFSECAWKEQNTVYCSTAPAKLFFDEYMHIFLGFGMWKTLVGYLFGYDIVLKYNRYQDQHFLDW